MWERRREHQFALVYWLAVYYRLYSSDVLEGSIGVDNLAVYAGRIAEIVFGRVMNLGFRWGILGPGKIAHSFARDLRYVPGATLVGVGSRSIERANAFGDEFGALRRYGSYEELVADQEVDAIYIATPHPMHAENSLLCLRAGKAVLCEKPFTINAREAQQVIDEARSRKLFLMEAMWTRFLPVMVRLRQMIKEGVIGEARMVQADFGFRKEIDLKSRFFDLNLGGGGLLDVGIYPLTLSAMLFGPPTDMASLANLGISGVDEENAFILRHVSGALSMLTSGVRLATQQDAMILGTEGRIRIPSSWWNSKSMELIRDGKTEIIECPFEGEGYHFEAMEVERCMRAGLTESKIMSLDETLSIMQTMDALRKQWGMKYPNE